MKHKNDEMGTAAGILILPLLAILTIVMVTLYFITKNKNYWKALAISWGVLMMLFLLFAVINKMMFH